MLPRPFQIFRGEDPLFKVFPRISMYLENKNERKEKLKEMVT
jgi:hypothetical protein